MANEEFCLQSDSHVDLIPDWDMALMNMWGMTQNEYAILSTQPTGPSTKHRMCIHVPHYLSLYCMYVIMIGSLFCYFLYL